MATLGEIVRWSAIAFGNAVASLRRTRRCAAARILRRDALVASSERRFRSLIEAAPDATVIVDWHGHIQLVNEQAERLLGWSGAELIGQNIAEPIPPGDRGAHREHVRRYLRDPHRRPVGGGLQLSGLRRDGLGEILGYSARQLETTGLGSVLPADEAAEDTAERRRLLGGEISR